MDALCTFAQSLHFTELREVHLDWGQKCGSGTEYKLWDARGNLLTKFHLDSSLGNDNFDWGL